MPSNTKLALLKTYIKHAIKEAILREDETPGGGLTFYGAEFKTDPSQAIADAMKALASADGNAEEAAKILGISTRRMYDYISMIPKLNSAQDRFQEEEKAKEETEKIHQRKKEDEKQKEDEDK